VPYDRFTVIEIAPSFLNHQQLDACAATAYRLADSGHYSHLAVLGDVLAHSLREEAGVMVPEIGQVAVPDHSDGLEPCRGSGLYIGYGKCDFCPAVFCADCASTNARTFKDYDDALCLSCAEARESRALATTDQP
jgi:hypothetical protein